MFSKINRYFYYCVSLLVIKNGLKNGVFGCCSKKICKNPNTGKEKKAKVRCLYTQNSKNCCSVQLPSVFFSHVIFFGIFSAFC